MAEATQAAQEEMNARQQRHVEEYQAKVQEIRDCCERIGMDLRRHV